METHVILLWILFVISLLVLIFAHKVADIIISYKMAKLNKDHSTKSTKKSYKSKKVEEEKPNIYTSGQFDSTNVYKKDEIIKHFDYALDFIQTIKGDTELLKSKLVTIKESYKNIDLIEDKLDLNNINRNIIFFLGSFSEFKSTYNINLVTNKLTDDFLSVSIETLSANLEVAQVVLEESYEKLVNMKNEIFIRSTQAKTDTMESIKKSKLDN